MKMIPTPFSCLFSCMAIENSILGATHAAARLESGPIRQGWILRLGPGGGLLGEDRFDVLALDAAMQAARELVDYDGDAAREQRDYDRKHAADHLS